MSAQIADFGLEEDVIDVLYKIFEEHTEVDEVIIFGSRAKGNYSKGSDIDLALKGKAVNLDTILTMMARIEKSGLLYKVDIHNYHRIKDKDITDHIQRAGKIFWKRTP